MKLNLISKSFYYKNQSTPEAQENRRLPANCTFSCFTYFTKLANIWVITMHIIFGYSKDPTIPFLTNICTYIYIYYS